MVNIESSEAAEGARSLVMPSAFDEVTGGFGEEEHAAPEDNCIGKLNGYRDSGAG